MKVYVIIDISGYYFNSEDNDHSTYARDVAYLTKEKAYEVICREILVGDFVNGYGESLILQDNEYPTMDELLDDFGWTYECGPEYEGYRIQEMEVIE